MLDNVGGLDMAAHPPGRSARPGKAVARLVNPLLVSEYLIENAKRSTLPPVALLTPALPAAVLASAAGR